MKRFYILSLSLVLPACTGNGDDTTLGSRAVDASVADTSAADTGSTVDGGSMQDAEDAESKDAEATVSDAGDSGAGDASGDMDGGCPAAWFEAPEVDPSIALPDGGGAVILHAGGTGTQNYVCEVTVTDGGVSVYAWTLVTPQATLGDCHDAQIGTHFASAGGANFPEWQTTDGTYVVGQKHLPTFTPDGGGGSIPWLLLHAVDAGGAGPVSSAQYIQRLNTDGGIAPTTGCDDAGVGATANVPYTAEYFFYGP
jgi:hypothetical protein